MKQPNDECSKEFISCMNEDLVVLYMNARSLKNKFMSVLDLASKWKATIVLITEIWCNDSKESIEL